MTWSCHNGIWRRRDPRCYSIQMGGARAAILAASASVEVGDIPTFHAVALDEFSVFEPAYPSGIAANDYLLALGMTAAADVSASNPTMTVSGYSDVGASGYDNEGAGGNEIRTFAQYKFAAGTETGNLTFTMSTSNSVVGIARFSNVNTSSPIEGLQASHGAANPYTAPSITSLGPNRLAVFIHSISDTAGSPSNPLVNGSGGDAAPVLRGYAQTATDADRLLALYTCGVTDASTLSGWQQTAASSAVNGSFVAFFLKPIGA